VQILVVPILTADVEHRPSLSMLCQNLAGTETAGDLLIARSNVIAPLLNTGRKFKGVFWRTDRMAHSTRLMEI
jgi:hypothetical protein